MKLYETKQNRKKLISSFNTKSKFIYFEKLYEDCDFVIKSNTKKVAVFNSSLIDVKSKRDTIGDKVLNIKKSERVSYFKDLEASSLRKSDVYRVYQLPVNGVMQGLF